MCLLITCDAMPTLFPGREIIEGNYLFILFNYREYIFYAARLKISEDLFCLCLRKDLCNFVLVYRFVHLVLLLAMLSTAMPLRVQTIISKAKVLLSVIYDHWHCDTFSQRKKYVLEQLALDMVMLACVGNLSFI